MKVSMKISPNNTKLNLSLILVGSILSRVFNEVPGMAAYFFALLGSLMFFIGLILLLIRVYQKSITPIRIVILIIAGVLVVELIS